MSSFAEILKNTRISKQLTQKQLAEHLKISERSYQNYEYGNREPNFDTVIKIADYLNCSVDFLLGRTKNYEINK